MSLWSVATQDMSKRNILDRGKMKWSTDAEYVVMIFVDSTEPMWLEAQH